MSHSGMTCSRARSVRGLVPNRQHRNIYQRPHDRSGAGSERCSLTRCAFVTGQGGQVAIYSWVWLSRCGAWKALLGAVYGLGVVLRNLCCGCSVSLTMPLKRTHADGIRCSIHEDNSTHYTISVTYRQTRASFLASRETTLDGAKRIADDEVRKSGHVCDGACKDWEAT